MGVQLFKNNADSTVNGTIAVGASFFNVAPGHGTHFPTPTGGDYFLATLFEKNVSGDEINFEIVKVTAVTGDTLTVVRDFEGIVVGNGGTSGGWAYPSAPGVNPSQVVYVQLRLTAYGAGNALAKDGNLAGLSNAATARANLGLGNVNNTADLDKPISTATQTALNGKATSAQGAKADSALQPAAIGTTVQAHDAATAKTNVAQTWTSSQKSGNVTDNDGSFDLSAAGNNYTSAPTGAVAITFTNIAANSNKSGYIVLTNASNYAYTAHANTKITTTDLAKIGKTGTHVLPYLCDGTDVLILGVWTKP